MFDVLIEGATIVDGSGKSGWIGDVAVRDGRILEISNHIEGQAARRFHAKGLVVAPGFVDIHGHSDFHFLDHPDGEIKLRQGVTLDVAGNCGLSAAPLCTERREEALSYCLSILGKPSRPIEWNWLKEYIETVRSGGLCINAAIYAGHSTIRTLAMGFSDRAPTSKEMDRMKEILARTLDEGAVGLSSGLAYLPGCYAEIGELIELATLVSRKGGFYVTHLRNESTDILNCVQEAIEIGRRAQLPVQISHLKISGARNWSLLDKLIDVLESARLEGIDVTCDVYPYLAASTTLLSILPPWAQEGGIGPIMNRLEDPALRRRMVDQIQSGLEGWQNYYLDAGWDKIRIAAVQSGRGARLEGRSIAELAVAEKKDPFDYALDLLRAEEGAVLAVFETMSEEVVSRLLSLPFVMAGSDGVANGSKPHPRLYGTFPRYIAKYVRDRRVLSLEEMIRKMTSFPCRRLGLTDRGLLRTGFWADMVVFDPETFEDRATFDDPCRFPVGLHLVLVNGKIALERERHLHAPAGRFLTRHTTPGS